MAARPLLSRPRIPLLPAPPPPPPPPPRPAKNHRPSANPPLPSRQHPALTHSPAALPKRPWTHTELTLLIRRALEPPLPSPRSRSFRWMQIAQELESRSWMACQLKFIRLREQQHPLLAALAHQLNGSPSPATPSLPLPLLPAPLVPPRKMAWTVGERKRLLFYVCLALRRGTPVRWAEISTHLEGRRSSAACSREWLRIRGRFQIPSCTTNGGHGVLSMEQMEVLEQVVLSELAELGQHQCGKIRGRPCQWTAQELAELLQSLPTSVLDPGATFPWKQVQVAHYSSKQCRQKWNHILQLLRKHYRDGNHVLPPVLQRLRDGLSSKNRKKDRKSLAGSVFFLLRQDSEKQQQRDPERRKKLWKQFQLYRAPQTSHRRSRSSRRAASDWTCQEVLMLRQAVQHWRNSKGAVPWTHVSGFFIQRSPIALQLKYAALQRRQLGLQQQHGVVSGESSTSTTLCFP